MKIPSDAARAQVKFDAVIVGAGSAGAAAAIALARAGWSVALVEQQRFPRTRVCGECLVAGCQPLLAALGVAAELDGRAGPALRRLTLHCGEQELSTELAAAPGDGWPWGRAPGPGTLDDLLLERARAVGAQVLQPWALRTLQGGAGAWFCELRAVESPALLRLRASVLIDATGAREGLPGRPEPRPPSPDAADLFAFRGSFTGTALAEGVFATLALDGGYGSMVVGAGGITALSCCIRRDRLSGLRCAAPGLRTGDAVQAWLQRECGGVRRALAGATLQGPWLASGPLVPGARLRADDEVFRIGNAAGAAHPILAEGSRHALQSAALLCARLLKDRPGSPVPDGLRQPALQRAYAADWQRVLAPRLRLAALLAHAAMRPRSAALLMSVARVWPGLLVSGARWGRGRAAPGPALPLQQPQSS